MKETAVVLRCEGEELVGVVTEPDRPTEHAVLILVGGPQYRIGSHRQFVHLARHLAGRGIASMRFDFRGIGDAGGSLRWTFLGIEPDIGVALDALQSVAPHIKRVTLWGLCGGASAALLYWRLTRDPRVAAMALVNPWLRTETTLARTRVKHYYLGRLAQWDFWRKLFSGRVASAALLELLGALRRTAQSVIGADKAAQPDLSRKMAEGWAGFDGPILLVLSGQDYTAKEFLESVSLHAEWRRNLALPNVRRLDLTDADHTFSQPDARATVERASAELAFGATAPV